MLIKRDLSELLDAAYADYFWAAENGYLFVYDPQMQDTIREFYPDIELEVDDAGQITKVTPTRTPEKTADEKIAELEAQNQMLKEQVKQLLIAAGREDLVTE